MAIVRKMVTDAGTKHPRSVIDLATETGLKPDLVRGCLLALGNSGLVRPLDEQSRVWEIAHDFVARLLAQVVGGWRTSWWRTLRPWIAPASLALWCGMLFVALPAYRTYVAEARFSALGALGIPVTRTGDAYHVGFPPSLSEKADLVLRDAAPHLRQLTVLELDIANTELTDCAPLANLTNLRTLNLSATRVADAGPLANLANLHGLDLSGTPITDASPLAQLAKLQSLDLSHTQVANAAPLGKLTNLQSLDLSGTAVANATPLGKLTNLQSLDLSGTQTAEIAQFAYLTDLRVLRLRDTQVSNIASLRKLHKLQMLDLAGTKIKDISPLRDLIELQNLTLSGMDLTSLAPLSYLVNLQSLDLDRTEPVDLSPLAMLQQLQWLNLSNARVEDLAPLAKLEKFTNPLSPEHERARPYTICRSHQSAKTRSVGHPGRRRRCTCQAYQAATTRPLAYGGRQRRLARQARHARTSRSHGNEGFSTRRVRAKAPLGGTGQFVGSYLWPVMAKVTPRTPALMLQGTGSHVGKSLLVAGLCRAFARRGLRVAPVQAAEHEQQRGGDAGRRRDRAGAGAAGARLRRPAVGPHEPGAAEAAERDRRAGGRAGAASAPRCSARDYAQLKPSLLPQVLESFAELAAATRTWSWSRAPAARPRSTCAQDDIANMGFAAAADLPVVLVGDIDRGGVIAALVGTHALLEEAERARLKGYLINKFRGDPRLFDEAHPVIRGRTGMRSFGVVPWFERARLLPAEDILGLDERVPRRRRRRDPDRGAAAAAARQFRRSRPARRRARRRARRSCRRATPLPGDADLVILPGSKATLADLAALRAEGWDVDLAAHRPPRRRGAGPVRRLCRCWAAGSPIPRASRARRALPTGLGLLDLETTLAPIKRARAGRRHRAPERRAGPGLRDAHGPDARAGARPAAPGARRPARGRGVGRRADHGLLPPRPVRGRRLSPRLPRPAAPARALRRSPTSTRSRRPWTRSPTIWRARSTSPACSRSRALRC